MRQTRRFVPGAALVLVGLGWGCVSLAPTASGRASAGVVPPGPAGAIRAIEHLGTAALARGTKTHGLPVGGLSGIAWEADSGVIWAISDDRSREGPARMVRLEHDAGVRTLTARDSVVLLRVDGTPYESGSIDAEGLARTPEGTFLIASEGDASRGIQPFLREVDRDGNQLQDYPLPLEFLVDGAGRSGVRDNLGFEGLAVSVDGREIVLATENALAQDGPRAGLTVGSPIRLLRLDRATGEPIAQHLYLTEPIARAPRPRSGFAVNGLASILAVDARRLLVLERSFSDGVGVTVKLFEADLDGATDVTSLATLDGTTVRPVAKRLVLDFSAAGVPLDNYEGLAWGPPRADGRRTLLAISDDNFSILQRTLLASFAIELAPPALADIQGRGPQSPLEGQCVSGVEAVVAALRPDRREPGFWVVDSGSQGLFVESGEHPLPEAGQLVRLGGCVAERRRSEPDPSRTVLVLDRTIEVLGPGSLPQPLVIGSGELEPPRGVVDDDGGSDFDPLHDALDFWSALEGNLVSVPDPLVVGPLDNFGQIVVVPDGGRYSGPTSPRGGLVGIETAVHPERLVLAPPPGGRLPPAKVGDRLGGVTGLVEFRWGAWRLVTTEPVEIAAAAPWVTAPARWAGQPRSIASYNVLNLSAVLDKERFERLARSIVADLGSPALVALQEIQDDSGPTDDGVTSAELGLRRLVDAIEGVGGPRYEAVALDPEDNQDGGQPGGNIRVALLVDPMRASVIRRETPGPVVPANLPGGGAGPSSSPGRLFVEEPAFANGDGEGGSRKPLVVEVELGSTRLVVVVCHLASKSGDDPVLGRRQPPLRLSDAKRLRQARLVLDWVEALVALDPGTKAIVLGDFNDVPWRPTIRLLADAGPLVHLQSADRSADYSFNWQGVSDLLDHAFVTPALFEAARPQLEIVHRNVDLPVDLAVSDHDPLLITFELPP